jgi:tetratricopeptide (TPR) repeat protein
VQEYLFALRLLRIMRRPYLSRTVPLLAAAGFAAAGAAAWLLLTERGGAKLAHAYERVMFQLIADRITAGSRSPEEAVARLMAYAHTRVVTPAPTEPARDEPPLDILVRGQGWCDQSANVFIHLARTLPLDARLVFLRDRTGHSPHSVAEVYVDGAWRMADLALGAPIFTEDGALATREELARDPTLVTAHPAVDAMVALASSEPFTGRLALYRQEPSVFNTWRGRRYRWLDRLREPLRGWVVARLQDAYLARSALRAPAPGTDWLLRGRHYSLLGRKAAAARCYRRAIAQSTDEPSRQAARFTLGRFYRRQGRYAEAIPLLEEALSSGSLGAWRTASTHLSLARAYDGLGETGKALEEYAASVPVIHDAVAAMRARQLRQGGSGEVLISEAGGRLTVAWDGGRL